MAVIQCRCECDTHVVNVAELHGVLRLAVLLGLGQGGGGGQGDRGHQAQSPHSGHRDLTKTHNHPQCQKLKCTHDQKEPC